MAQPPSLYHSSLQSMTTNPTFMFPEPKTIPKMILRDIVSALEKNEHFHYVKTIMLDLDTFHECVLSNCLNEDQILKTFQTYSVDEDHVNDISQKLMKDYLERMVKDPCEHTLDLGVWLGNILSSAGLLEESITVYATCLESCKTFNTNTVQDVTRILNVMKQLLHDRHVYHSFRTHFHSDEDEKHVEDMMTLYDDFRKWLNRSQTFHVDGHFAVFYNELACFHYYLKNYTKACIWTERALKEIHFYHDFSSFPSDPFENTTWFESRRATLLDMKDNVLKGDHLNLYLVSIRSFIRTKRVIEIGILFFDFLTLHATLKDSLLKQILYQDFKKEYFSCFRPRINDAPWFLSILSHISNDLHDKLERFREEDAIFLQRFPLQTFLRNVTFMHLWKDFDDCTKTYRMVFGKGNIKTQLFKRKIHNIYIRLQ